MDTFLDIPRGLGLIRLSSPLAFIALAHFGRAKPESLVNL
jgi:hypothetical protein